MGRTVARPGDDHDVALPPPARDDAHVRHEPDEPTTGVGGIARPSVSL